MHGHDLETLLRKPCIKTKGKGKRREELRVSELEAAPVRRQLRGPKSSFTTRGCSPSKGRITGYSGWPQGSTGITSTRRVPKSVVNKEA